jgi:hypothetical protein
MPNSPPEAPVIRIADPIELRAAVKRIAALGDPQPATAEWLELLATKEAVRLYREARNEIDSNSGIAGAK